MPTSVVIAVIAAVLLAGEGFVTAASAYSNQARLPILPVVRLCIAALIIGALVNQSRLAWQWGRFVGALTSIWSLFILYFLVSGNEATTYQMVSLSISAVLGLTMAIALERRTAIEYFRLVCPQCGSTKSKPVDFWFKTAKCRKCDAKF